MSNAPRVDRAERVISASADAVYAALVDADALVEWLPPATMTGDITEFDATVGGGFRMVLRYPPDAAVDRPGPGKASDLEDLVDVTFTALEPGAEVEWQATFDSPDPAFAGVMTQTWTLSEGDRSGVTRVVIEARGVPEGISVADHEIGLNTSLEQLDAWVTTHG